MRAALGGRHIQRGKVEAPSRGASRPSWSRVLGRSGEAHDGSTVDLTRRRLRLEAEVVDESVKVLGVEPQPLGGFGNVAAGLL